MQYTTRRQPRRLVAVVKEGLATDAELATAALQLGAPVAVRLLVASGGSSCCGSHTSGPSLVALDPADAALPAAQSLVVRTLQPGVALVDQSWAALAGGSVALPYVDVLITSSQEFSCGDAPAPTLLTLTDLAMGLTATAKEHYPRVQTLIVVDEVAAGVVPDDWRVVGRANDGIPVQTGLVDLAPAGAAK